MPDILGRDFVLDEKTMPVIEGFGDSMPGGFFIYKADPSEELIYVNDAMVKIFGCESKDDLRAHTGNSFAGVVHPMDYSNVSQSIEKQIAENGDNMDRVEYRIIAKDGTVRWVEDYGRYIETEAYGPVYCVFIDDATERYRDRMSKLEQMNRELKNTNAREDQYRKAILHNAYVFFEVNLTKDTFIASAGRCDKDLFDFMGIPHFEKYSEFLHYWSGNVIEDDKADFERFFSIERLIGCYHSGDPEQVTECYAKTRTGKKRLFRFVSYIGENEFTGDAIALSLAKDITDDLEKQRQFQTALQEANAANIARRTFLDNMSHDIRTPLNSIIGYTELIRSNMSDNEKMNHYLDHIKLSGKQLLKIVTESLELTRMESGKAVLNKGECSLEDLINEIKLRIEPDADEKEIKLIIDKSGIKNYDVYADHLRFEEVIWQLMDNAVKYTDKGGEVRLTISESEGNSKGFGVYTITVEDNGIGIDEEFRKTIFEPFKRVENTTISGVFGSGLGLAVAKNIVDMMNGTIAVESEHGRGSRFTVTVTLPLQGIQHTIHDSDGVAYDTNILRGMHILVVEDNPVNLEIEQEMLEYCGCIVDTAINGKEAVEKISALTSKVYDIILMDIQMPVMNGYEATRCIRRLENPTLAGIPIIAVSANAFEDDRERSLESGMNAHFPKPIDMTELEILITKILRSK